MTQKDAKSGSGGSSVSTTFPWTAESLYDAMMYMIESEQMTVMIPILPEMYEGESPEEGRERAARYAAAFKELEEKMAAFWAETKSDLKSFSKAYVAEIKKRAKQNEEQILSDIESSFGSA